MSQESSFLSAGALRKLHDEAILAAQAAGKVLRRHFGKKLKVSEKPGAGLVTNADYEAQHQIVKRLKKASPQFGFLTEEADPVASKNLGRWIIDPLDGTTNFVHGFPMFCVSIAAEWAGQLCVGVIYHPIHNEIYTAIRGKGAYLNGKKLNVSKVGQLRHALLTTGFTYRKGNWLQQEMKLFESMSQNTQAIRRPGSAALDLAYTARGVFDGFWERRLSPWDIAAGILLVVEAGGKVTDFNGNTPQLEGGEILASNGKLHTALLKNM